MRQRPNIVGGAVAVLWLVIILIPVLLMVRAAFESPETYANQSPLSLPREVTFQNFVDTIELGFARNLLNAAIITVGTVLIVVVVVPPLSFAIVRSSSRAVANAFRLMLLGLAIPAQVVVVPVFYLISQLGLYNSLIGVILPTAAFAIPVCTLVLTGAMRNIGDELFEAMAIDGASSWTMFRRMVVPLSGGGIATIVVFSALQAWNGFLLPLILTNSPELTVATVGLNQFRSQYSVNVPGLMSAVILTIIPILLVYLFARRALVSGVMGMGGK
jgi:xylobiose transport system permease protein